MEKEVLKEECIDYLAFGVYKGESLKWWIDNNNNRESSFVGFDTFTGLPESWDNIKKGTFSVNGKIPDIQEIRCSFKVGLFQDTLFPFLEKYSLNRKTIVHFDADLYSSTLFVLITLMRRLKKGDILIFDDFWSATHEFRALLDFLSLCPHFKYELLGAINNYSQIALKVV